MDYHYIFPLRLSPNSLDSPTYLTWGNVLMESLAFIDGDCRGEGGVSRCVASTYRQHSPPMSTIDLGVESTSMFYL